MTTTLLCLFASEGSLHTGPSVRRTHANPGLHELYHFSDLLFTWEVQHQRKMLNFCIVDIKPQFAPSLPIHLMVDTLPLNQLTCTNVRCIHHIAQILFKMKALCAPIIANKRSLCACTGPRFFIGSIMQITIFGVFSKFGRLYTNLKKKGI